MQYDQIEQANECLEDDHAEQSAEQTQRELPPERQQPFRQRIHKTAWLAVQFDVVLLSLPVAQERNQEVFNAAEDQRGPVQEGSEELSVHEHKAYEPRCNNAPEDGLLLAAKSSDIQIVFDRDTVHGNT
jgi:hypothetical protein